MIHLPHGAVVSVCVCGSRVLVILLRTFCNFFSSDTLSDFPAHCGTLFNPRFSSRVGGNVGSSLNGNHLQETYRSISFLLASSVHVLERLRGCGLELCHRFSLSELIAPQEPPSVPARLRSLGRPVCNQLSSVAASVTQTERQTECVCVCSVCIISNELLDTFE